MFQIYFTGCGGDITVGKYNDGSREARQLLYERMYAAMKSSAAATRLSPLDAIQWRLLPVQFTPRSDGKYDPAKCRALLADVKQKSRDRFGAAMWLANAERFRKPVELSCVRIGPA